MGEFFIVSKFQGKGIGRYVAKQVFEQFPGLWEVHIIPENRGALLFWEKVIRDYTNNKFEKNQKVILESKPHPMIILKFKV